MADPFAFDCPHFSRHAFEDGSVGTVQPVKIESGVQDWFRVPHEEHEHARIRSSKRRKSKSGGSHDKENVTEDDVFALLEKHNKRRKSSDKAKVLRRTSGGGRAPKENQREDTQRRKSANKPTKKTVRKSKESSSSTTNQDVFALLDEHNKKRKTATSSSSKISSGNKAKVDCKLESAEVRKAKLQEWKRQKELKKQEGKAAKGKSQGTTKEPKSKLKQRTKKGTADGNSEDDVYALLKQHNRRKSTDSVGGKKSNSAIGAVQTQAKFCAAPTPNLITTQKTLVTSKSSKKAVSSTSSAKPKTKSKPKPAGSKGTKVKDSSSSSSSSKRRESTEEEEMLKMIALHNRGLSQAQSSYEPQKHSVRDIRVWEKHYGKTWHSLNTRERADANHQIADLKQKKTRAK